MVGEDGWGLLVAVGAYVGLRKQYDVWQHRCRNHRSVESFAIGVLVTGFRIATTIHMSL